MIWIGGKGNYLREGNTEWLFVAEESRSSYLDFPHNLESACPDLTEFSYLGQEILNGQSVKRYAAPTVTLKISRNPDRSRLGIFGRCRWRHNTRSKHDRPRPTGFWKTIKIIKSWTFPASANRTRSSTRTPAGHPQRRLRLNSHSRWRKSWRQRTRRHRHPLPVQPRSPRLHRRLRLLRRQHLCPISLASFPKSPPP